MLFRIGLSQSFLRDRRACYRLHRLVPTERSKDINMQQLSHLFSAGSPVRFLGPDSALRCWFISRITVYRAKSKSTTLWRQFRKRPSFRRLFRNCSSQGTNSSSVASPLDWHAMLGPWGLESRRYQHSIRPFRA